MRARRKIYAMLMVAVYTVATLLSSVSLLLCEHHSHHHSHRAEKHHSCHCNCSAQGDIAFAEDCCNHQHPVLGDNHTDYIAASQRSDSRASQAVMLILAPALCSNVLDEQPRLYVGTLHICYGDETEPLRAATTSPWGLRAPPALA